MSERTFFTLRYALPGYTFILVTVLINFSRLQSLVKTEVFVAFLAFLYLLSGSAIGFLISQSWYIFYNDVVPIRFKLRNVQTFLACRFGIRREGWIQFTVFLDYTLLLSEKQMVEYIRRRWDLMHTLGSTLFATLIGSLAGLLISTDFSTLSIKPIEMPITLLTVFVQLPVLAIRLAFIETTGYNLGVTCVVASLCAVLAYGLRHVWIEHDMMSEVVLHDVVDSKLGQERLSLDRRREIFHFLDFPDDQRTR